MVDFTLFVIKSDFKIELYYKIIHHTYVPINIFIRNNYLK